MKNTQRYDRIKRPKHTTAEKLTTGREKLKDIDGRKVTQKIPGQNQATEVEQDIWK